MNTSSLKNNVLIVTGGASGIGAATCLKLAEEGSSVVVSDINLEGAQAVSEKINKLGVASIAVQTDVASPKDNEELISQTLSKFGKIDGAFLNAGIVIGSTILDGDLEAWQKVVSVNLTGPYLGLRALAPRLHAGASVVITASVAGLRGSAYMPSYIASKHGVVGLAKSAAAEFARKKIRVNAVCPGGVETPILGVTGEDELKALGNMHPLQRLGQPQEIANLVSFLLSEQSSFVTGQAIAIDGGMTSVMPEGEAFPIQTESVQRSALLGD